MNQPSNTEQTLGRASLIAAIYIGVLSVAALLVMPVLVSGIISSLGFSEQTVGRLVSLEMAGLAIGSLLGITWIGRLDWRWVAAATLIILVVANGLSVFARDIYFFAVCRALAGVAGGTGMVLTNASLARFKVPSRGFAMYSVAQLSFGAVALWLFSYVIERSGIGVTYGILAVLCLFGLVLSRNIVDFHRASSSDDASHLATPWRQVLPALAAVLLIFVAQVGIWSFASQIGINGGLTQESAGYWLSLASIGGLSGALIALLVNVRFGRLLPIALGLLIQVVAVFFLRGDLSTLIFAVTTFGYYLCWNVIVPLSFGLIAEIDQRGKSITVATTLAAVGMSIGPLVAASLVSAYNYSAINVLVGFLNILCLTLFALTLRSHKRAKGQV